MLFYKLALVKTCPWAYLRTYCSVFVCIWAMSIHLGSELWNGKCSLAWDYRQSCSGVALACWQQFTILLRAAGVESLNFSQVVKEKLPCFAHLACLILQFSPRKFNSNLCIQLHNKFEAYFLKFFLFVCMQMLFII